MNYSQIDPVISKWVDVHGFTLFTGYENHPGIEFRSVYISSRLGECCQIWVDAPASGKVCVHAGDVETFQDEELKMEWSVPVEELEGALENAVNFIKSWFERKSA